MEDSIDQAIQTLSEGKELAELKSMTTTDAITRLWDYTAERLLVGIGDDDGQVDRHDIMDLMALYILAKKYGSPGQVEGTITDSYGYNFTTQQSRNLPLRSEYGDQAWVDAFRQLIGDSISKDSVRWKVHNKETDQWWSKDGWVDDTDSALELTPAARKKTMRKFRKLGVSDEYEWVKV